jgi:[ribosomal protein S5]-alanine N-acetyltransferase
MFPILNTPRLALRPLTEGDVPALFAIFKDPEAMRYWANPAMIEMAEAESLLREIQRHAEAETLFQWGIVRREEDLVIGTCTLFRINREHRRGELGYILRRDLWGYGFATEALTALVDHSFATLGLHRVEADIDPRNAGSIRLVERLGFKKEGHLRERYFVAGDIQDSVIYGLLAPDWRSR